MTYDVFSETLNPYSRIFQLIKLQKKVRIICESAGFQSLLCGDMVGEKTQLTGALSVMLIIHQVQQVNLKSWPHQSTITATDTEALRTVKLLSTTKIFADYRHIQVEVNNQAMNRKVTVTGRAYSAHTVAMHPFPNPSHPVGSKDMLTFCNYAKYTQYHKYQSCKCAKQSSLHTPGNGYQGTYPFNTCQISKFSNIQTFNH